MRTDSRDNFVSTLAGAIILAVSIPLFVFIMGADIKDAGQAFGVFIFASLTAILMIGGAVSFIIGVIGCRRIHKARRQAEIFARYGYPEDYIDN